MLPYIIHKQAKCFYARLKNTAVVFLVPVRFSTCAESETIRIWASSSSYNLLTVIW